MSIIYGELDFSNPTKLISFSPPEEAGLYVILVPEFQDTGFPAKPIYFGQTENYAERGFLSSHIKRDCWIKEAIKEEYLSISIYPMPDSTEEERMEIESKLIARYHTDEICNG